MKKKSRIIALCLALAIICAGLIMVVSAEASEFDLVSALNEAESGSTVTMTGDATIASTYDVKNDVLAHGDIPEEYWWCSGHFSYAKRELKRMVESGVFRESTTVMWY